MHTIKEKKKRAVLLTHICMDYKKRSQYFRRPILLSDNCYGGHCVNFELLNREVSFSEIAERFTGKICETESDL